MVKFFLAAASWGGNKDATQQKADKRHLAKRVGQRTMAIHKVIANVQRTAP